MGLAIRMRASLPSAGQVSQHADLMEELMSLPSASRVRSQIPIDGSLILPHPPPDCGRAPKPDCGLPKQGSSKRKTVNDGHYSFTGGAMADSVI